MKNEFNPGAEMLKPDKKQAIKTLEKAKKNQKKTKFVYKLENKAIIFSNKSLAKIEKIYNQKAILLPNYNE